MSENTPEFLKAHKKAETFSRYIEVLLHASESPLTDSELKKHLMQQNHIHHFLIGEQFMKTDNAGEALAKLLATL